MIKNTSRSFRWNTWHRKYIFILVFQTLTGSMSGYVVPCKDSLHTISSVLSCPRNKIEYLNAVKRKNCQDKAHSCPSFEYHCVLNDWMNDTIEVCAPSLLIVGGVCAEFNLEETSIRGSFLTNCTAFDTPCPQAYKSTTSYKYPDCYFNTQNGLSSKKRNFTSNEGMDTGDEKNVILIVSLVLVSMIVLSIMAFAYFFRKHIQKCFPRAHKTDKRRKVRYSTPNGSDQAQL